ncbi:unnamed protein product [Nyctereutes procyonoides]|uniref:Apolipoprotein C-I n=1 Tax=Nyctereutes procyonoides TaxID=34880 RepID=A0A811YNE3_NYCPR|nr:unnamed protein product [Nyctereutes procyonoides]
MRLILSLPVVAVVLWMVLEGPALAQVASQITRTLECIPDKLKDIKLSGIPAKIRDWFMETYNKVKEWLKTNYLLLSARRAAPSSVAVPQEEAPKFPIPWLLC